MKHKIAHIITDLDIGGSEMMLYKLISRMNKDAFENIVISLTNKGRLAINIEKCGTKVYALGMKRGIPNPFSLVHLLKILQKEKPSLIQTWLYHADLLGTIVAKIYKIPVLWNIRCSDMDLRMYSKTTRFVVNFCAMMSTYPSVIISNSEAGKIIHQKYGYKPKRWQLIPNGFDLHLYSPNELSRQKIRKELNVDKETVLIGMVGRYDPMKDHANFIKAAKILINDDSIKKDIRFVLIGRNINNRNQKLVWLIKRAGLKNNIILLDERSDIPDIMSALDIYCSSSSSEGFPNVIGEAMATGVPCIATCAGDSASIIGNTGKTVPIKQPLALALALKEYIELDRTQRLKLGIKARERIEKLYSLQSVVNQYEKLYEEIINNVRNSRTS